MIYLEILVTQKHYFSLQYLIFLFSTTNPWIIPTTTHDGRPRTFCSTGHLNCFTSVNLVMPILTQPWSNPALWRSLRQKQITYSMEFISQTSICNSRCLFCLLLSIIYHFGSNPPDTFFLRIISVKHHYNYWSHPKLKLITCRLNNATHIYIYKLESFGDLENQRLNSHTGYSSNDLSP